MPPAPGHGGYIGSELITPSYTGGLPGDPRGGRTRLLTTNVCSGSVYFLGVQQLNGGPLVDKNGGDRFDGPEEQGYVDWGDVTYASGARAAGRRGLAALRPMPNCHAPFSMVRVLGDPNQFQMNETGRRVAIAWVGNGTFAAQSLARDLSLAADGSLRQRFVPELRRLRMRATSAPGMQAEVQARVIVPANKESEAAPGSFGFSVLGVPGDAEQTRVGIDLATGTAFIDGTLQGNAAVRAAPLLGSSSNVSIHAYADHSYVTAIFNGQVALTAVVAPSSAAASRVEPWGAPASAVKLDVWELAPAHGHYQ